MIAARDGLRGHRVAITGIGCHVPERVLDNDELALLVDTSDEWIRERTGIRERRIAAPEEALSDICLPAARQALERAGASPAEIDLIVVATVTPDTLFPATAALLADRLGAHDVAAYDLSSGCAGFLYALAQAHAAVAAGLSRRALVVGGDVLSRIMDWGDRATCIVFGDGAGAVVLDRVEDGGFLGFELGADGSGAEQLWLPGGGSRVPATAESVASGQHFIKMNGSEVFRFATRVMAASAVSVLDACGLAKEDIDLYVPHQANLRIIDHAVRKLGIDEDRVVVNVDRFGNTSCGSIPLALGDAYDAGRLRDGELVLMTGVGAGLTWGSTVIDWRERKAA